MTGTAARYTYQLDGGSSDLRLWTTPPHSKVFPETTRSPLPDATDQELRIYAARYEYEPVQVIVWSAAAGNATVALPSFGIGETVSLHSVEYVNVTTPTDSGGETGLWPDPLLPRQPGEAIPVSAGRNKPLWITVYVPPSAAAGDYEGTLTITAPDGSRQVPVSLHVFDFTLPAEIGLKSQMNVSHQALGGGASLERVEEIKSFFHAHRLTPKSVAWPAGLNYNGGITYDCVSQSFDDTDGGAYSFSQLGPKYVDGQGWNGVGFPSFMAFQFVSNSTPRPSEFCGTAIGADPYGTAAYNTRWQGMLSALDAYLVEHGYEDKAYHYLMNEPQDQDDYDLAAFLASMSKAVAPNLRLAISEEPKAEIFDNDRFPGASFDVWIANIPAYDQARATALERQSEHGEEVWWYSLPHDAPPYFNPTTIDHIGLESRLLGLAAFALRADGYAYYSLTGWGDPWDYPNPGNGNGDGFLLYPEPGTTESPTRFIPSIRLELLREAFEDYEYLLLANGGTPAAGSAAVADPTAQSAVSSLTSWTRDAEGVSELRMQLGRYVAGERSDLPVLVPDAPARERGAYYINFQDPAGEPTSDPLVVDGNEYLKIGWEAWSDAAGYGWFGENIGTDRVKTQWLENLPVVDPRQRSIIYDDWGRKTVFEFALESGAYDVTVSCGWANRGSYQHQRVIAEGVAVIEPGDTTTVNDRFYIVDTERVELTDGKLTLEVGGVVADGDYRYTMLNYVDIVPAE
ncbi:MAG: DUF4091 domain-containing protein [Armatimonadia bacterium]|nr:DUF4091 domain-containing protein [Armatimonadia bacterium]